MKIAPVSADLLIKLGLLVGGAWAVYALLNKAGNIAGDAWDASTSAIVNGANAVNPLNNNNVIYQTANTVTGGSNDLGAPTLGTRIWEFFHPGQ